MLLATLFIKFLFKMTTSAPDIGHSGGLIPPPLRLHKMGNSTNAMPSSHYVSNTQYKEHRLGYHPVVGSGTKSQVYSSSNRTYLVPSTKVPMLPSIPVTNSVVSIYLIIIGKKLRTKYDK